MYCVESRTGRHHLWWTALGFRRSAMPSTGKFTLRPHQIEAVDAVVRGLDIPPGKRIPRAGLRATVVAACGTGKTFIAAHSALRLARNGRVLVLLPTLDLLTQTVREWRAAGHHGPAVAVCSLEDDPHRSSCASSVRRSTSTRSTGTPASGARTTRSARCTKLLPSRWPISVWKPSRWPIPAR
ncbi:DEAD/DEAH box helicase family protein [Streptomyces sp. 130]|uniref:DEAD/DEAH box helicase family protein n=1 Tax=Streptomyces sp. 130 TaxID=2591006 RepID=UPI0037D9E723